MHDTEDKSYWVTEYAKKESEFVKVLGPRLGLDAKINPAKERDPYAPDLVVDGIISDLKCQQTPFFKAHELFGIDPQFAVTFNKKDFSRYQSEYPTLDVYFWVDWRQLEKRIGGQVFRVEKMEGVWRAHFSELQKLVTAGAHLHGYQRRTRDTIGNARDSFVLDVRKFEELMLVGPTPA